MSIDSKLVAESSSELLKQLKKPVFDLGYVNLQVGYNKTLLENERRSILCVSVEYNNLLKETKVNKSELRNVIPKTFDYNCLKSKVCVEFAHLPPSVRKQLNEIKKYSLK